MPPAQQSVYTPFKSAVTLDFEEAGPSAFVFAFAMPGRIEPAAEGGPGRLSVGGAILEVA